MNTYYGWQQAKTYILEQAGFIVLYVTPAAVCQCLAAIHADSHIQQAVTASRPETVATAYAYIPAANCLDVHKKLCTLSCCSYTSELSLVALRCLKGWTSPL